MLKRCCFFVRTDGCAGSRLPRLHKRQVTRDGCELVDRADAASAALQRSARRVGARVNVAQKRRRLAKLTSGPSRNIPTRGCREDCRGGRAPNAKRSCDTRARLSSASTTPRSRPRYGAATRTRWPRARRDVHGCGWWLPSACGMMLRPRALSPPSCRRPSRKRRRRSQWDKTNRRNKEEAPEGYNRDTM